MSNFPRRTYSVVEAARMLGIGRNQGYEAVRRGDIPSIMIGKRRLIPRAAFDRLLGEDTVDPDTDSSSSGEAAARGAERDRNAA